MRYYKNYNYDPKADDFVASTCLGCSIPIVIGIVWFFGSLMCAVPALGALFFTVIFVFAACIGFGYLLISMGRAIEEVWWKPINPEEQKEALEDWKKTAEENRKKH